MGLLNKFVEMLKSSSPLRGTNPRQIQKEVDTLRLYLLTEYQQRCRSGYEPGDMDKKAFFTQAESLEYEEQLDRVRHNVRLQLIDLFSLFYQNDPLLRQTRREVDNTFDPDHFSLLGNPGNVAHKGDRDAIKAFNAILKKEFGFSLHNRPSSIPGAGNGIFVEGSVPPGTVVSIYPGVVYIRDYVQAGDHEGLFGTDDEGSYTMSRVDGTIINADCPQIGRRTPLSDGHIINHPSGIPADAHAETGAKLYGTPNVMVCPFDFPKMNSKESFPTELYQYIPNEFYKPPTVWSSEEAKVAHAQSILLVTTQEIRDSELFLDYRYNPKVALPAWYTPVNVEENRRRWAI